MILVCEKVKMQSQKVITFIALEQGQTDYIYQMITVVTYIIQSDLKLYQVDPIYQMITSSAISLSGFHCSRITVLKISFLYLEEMLVFRQLFSKALSSA